MLIFLVSCVPENNNGGNVDNGDSGKTTFIPVFKNSGNYNVNFLGITFISDRNYKYFSTFAEEEIEDGYYTLQLDFSTSETEIYILKIPFQVVKGKKNILTFDLKDGNLNVLSSHNYVTGLKTEYKKDEDSVLLSWDYNTYNINYNIYVFRNGIFKHIGKTDKRYFVVNGPFSVNKNMYYVVPEFYDEYPIPVSKDVMCLNIPEDMVMVEKSSFIFGYEGEETGYEEVKPSSKVTFTYDYLMGKYEITFNQFDNFCDETGTASPSDYYTIGTPFYLGRGEKPALNMTWKEALKYCNWLSEKEGIKPAYYTDVNGRFDGRTIDENGNVTKDLSKVTGYRLPTEQEWEYAAKGGKNKDSYKYSGSNILSEVANYRKNPNDVVFTREVGSYKPNSLGLYDMSGNVCEYCTSVYLDYTAEDKINPFDIESVNVYKPVIKGGGYYYDENTKKLENVMRIKSGSATQGNIATGFRIVRTVTE